MKVKDIMTKDIISCDVNASLKDAALLMLNYDIGFLPIKKNKKVIGCLTDRDIVILGVANENKKIEDCMKNVLITINHECEINEAIELMKEYKVRRLLVKNKSKLVGIISIADIVNNYVKNKEIVEMLKQILEIDKNSNVCFLKINDFEL